MESSDSDYRTAELTPAQHGTSPTMPRHSQFERARRSTTTQPWRPAAIGR